MQQRKTKISKKKSQVDIEFTDKILTSFGGTGSIISRFVEKINLCNFFENWFPVEEKSNNSTGVYSKIIAFFITVLNGGNRFSHLNLLNRDREIMETCFGVKKLPRSSTSITRFWNKFYKQSLNEKLLKFCFTFINRLLSAAKIFEDTLRFDSTVLTRYGNQDGAKRGYNPTKRGRPSHQPQIAFLGSGFTVNMWNRSGNISSRNGIIDFFEQTVNSLINLKIIRVLADSGYYCSPFIEHLEKHGYKYVISVPIISVLQSVIFNLQTWHKVSDGIEVAEFYFEHTAVNWVKPRRYVVVRQEIAQRPKATGKQLRIFDTLNEPIRYRHQLLITNDERSTPYQIWNYYKPRATDETIIENLKNGFGFDAFNLKNFWATEAVLMTVCLIFHNLYLYLIKKITKYGDQKDTLKSFRMKFLITPGILGKDGRRYVLRLGVRDDKTKNRFINILNIIEKITLNFNCNAVQDKGI